MSLPALVRLFPLFYFRFYVDKQNKAHIEFGTYRTFFSCEDAAQQVLMSSVRVCVPQVEILPSYSTQNVPECMQNVPE